jgi:hypothetical protein
VGRDGANERKGSDGGGRRVVVVEVVAVVERGGVAAVEGRVVEWWRNVAEARWRRRRVVGNG